MDTRQKASVVRVVRELARLWDEEASEAAYRLARAEYVAERGEAEAASVLREVAMDELRHLILVTRLHARDEVERDLPEMFAAMIEADRDAATRAEQMARLAQDGGLDEEAALFRRLAADERSHVARLERALVGLASRASTDALSIP
jgi:rubrerythrin